MIRRSLQLLVAMLSVLALPALAAGVGQVKTASGAVHIERAGQRLPAAPGIFVQQADRVVTGADGSVGIAFEDDSMLSAGPNSALEISQFVFDSTTHEGVFETTLTRGTLSAISGKIAKQTPEAMRVRTPSTILGVRGTEFLVRVEDAKR
jgi:hypothetical protein